MKSLPIADTSGSGRLARDRRASLSPVEFGDFDASAGRPVIPSRAHAPPALRRLGMTAGTFSSLPGETPGSRGRDARSPERRAFRSTVSLILFALVASVACRSAPPPTDEPLVAGFALPESRSVRAMMRVRLSRGEKTQSFRAQLVVQPSSERMVLTAYTPVGTAAATIFADGDRAVFLDHVNRTAWEGSAEELSRTVDLFGGAPARWAAAVVGIGDELPGAEIAREPAPPALPERVTVTSGDAKAEIVLSTLNSTGEIPRKPAIPHGYRCCVAPRM